MNDYLSAIYGNAAFIATPENLQHLAFSDTNMLLQHYTMLLRVARKTYNTEPTNRNADYIEYNRRKLQIECRKAQMLIAASRAERLGYTECTVSASPEDIELMMEEIEQRAFECDRDFDDWSLNDARTANRHLAAPWRNYFDDSESID